MEDDNSFCFSLTQEDLEKANEFIQKQRLDKRSEGAIGGRFTYEFTPTSLGLVTSVRDNITRNSLDLTDYSLW